MPSPDLHISMILGLLLVGCLIVGVLAELIHLPKITAYLTVGLLLGPKVVGLVHHEHVVVLEPLVNLAMGLVLFQLGCGFSLPKLRRILGPLTRLSIGELSATFVLVFAGTWIVTENLAISLLLSALALATAPATTVLVLNEAASDGPVTELAKGLVALNNLASIVVFEILFLILTLMRGPGEISVQTSALEFLWSMSGAVLFGVVLGLGISFACGLLKTSRWLILLVATNTLLLGLCEICHLSYMLAFLMMGFVVVNTSEHSRQIEAELKGMTGLLCVVFFVIHGTELDLPALWQAGALGLAYIVTRSVGKWVGIRAVAGWTQQPTSVKKYLGTTMLAQAGAAIALSTVAVQRDPVLGQSLQIVILGTVVFFELIGPVLIRQSVLRAGEVPLVQAIFHIPTTPVEQFLNVMNRLMSLLGLRPRIAPIPQETTVQYIMRSHVNSLPASASFSEVLSHIEHSHDDTYPVVDRGGCLIGTIRYHELSQEMMDPSVKQLVRADDLTSPSLILLTSDQRMGEVMEAFRQIADDCIPVVDDLQRRGLIGIIRRRDIMGMVVKHHGKNEPQGKKHSAIEFDLEGDD